MRASFKRIMLGIMAGCLITASVAHAQQGHTQYVSRNAVAAQEQGAYVPYQPQAVYTNTNWQTVDPLAVAESSYAQPQGYGQAGAYPRFYGEQDFGYQQGYACAPAYNPGLTCGKWFVTGWLDQGFTYNSDQPRYRQNGPLKFNDRCEEYQLNQLYLSMGRRVATSGCSWDFGGRVDLLYGSDYYWTSAIGLETRTQNALGHYQEDPTGLPSRWNSNNGPRGSYAGGYGASRFGLAMPQLYAEFYVPLHLGLNIKAGHFYSPMGYESVMSPQNFFYSHSYAMMYGEPMTHTGILFSQRLTQRLTGIFGVTRGWDTWEDPNDKLSFLAGFKWASCDGRTEFSWVGGSGNETVSDGQGGRSIPGAIRSNYSMVLSHQLTPRLKLVTQHDLGYGKDAAYELIDGTVNPVNGHWYSLSQYVFYQLTDKLSFGVRGEWFRDVNSTRIFRNYPVRMVDGAGNLVQQIDGQDYSEITVGFNWKPYDCLVIRPEARWDWSGVCKVDGNGDPMVAGMYDDFKKKEQTTVSISAYVTY